MRGGKLAKGGRRAAVAASPGTVSSASVSAVSRRPSAVLPVVLPVLLAVTLAGCGSSAKEEAQARRQAAEQQRLREKAAELEGEIKQLREQQSQLVQNQASQAQGTTTNPSPAPKGPSRDCGGGVAAGPNTSCAFALNTAQEWVDTSGGTTLQVYSPATKKSYTMRCVTGATGTTCKGGSGAVVYIP